MPNIALLSHQQAGVEFFKGTAGRALLFWATGTGKSFASLECARRIREAYPGEAILILCPASVVKQWHVEAERYLGSLTGIEIINYEKLLSPQYARRLWAEQHSLIIADECQMIASPVARRTKVFKKLHARFRLAMSATPAPNDQLFEFWSVMDWLSPGIWETSFYQFKAKHCITNFFKSIIGYRDEQRLRTLIAPYINRVEKVILNLPELHTQTIPVKLSDIHSKAIKDIQKQMYIETKEKKLTIPNAVAMISRLRQLVDCPQWFGLQYESEKMAELESVLCKDKQPTIIFCEHQATAETIALEYNCVAITGKTLLKRRAQIVEAFQKGQTNILVGTYALAVGLNIQRATRVISYSQYWSPARMDQAVGRSHRFGQSLEVEHINLIASGTVDEKIAALIEKKRLDGQKFSKEEILSLLK